MKLSDLMIGQQARVTEMVELSETIRRRLLDFGVLEGSLISISKMLPFGGPFTIEFNGQWIAIRRKEAARIAVEPC